MKRWIEGMMVSVFAVVVLALAFPAWAQDVVTAAVPEADLSGAVQALVNAAGNHSGLLVIIGLACGVLIQIGKTRFGGGLMNKVPSAVRLWIPFVLGAVVGFVERVQGGSPWVAALAGALLTGQSAVTLRKIFESHGGEKIMPVVK